MKKSLVTITITLLAIVLMHASPVLAAEYYLSPSGSDSNAGTKTSPWKSGTKAMTVLLPGDTLYLHSGMYTSALDITKSGSATQPIYVKPTDQNITIDINKSANVAFKISGSYVHASGITARNTNWAAIQVTGSHIVLDNVTATQTKSHGIIISGTDVVVKNSTVYEAVNENNPAAESNNWGSGLKVERNAKQVVFEHNSVYHNYGEGIATTMGADVTIRGNRVYDNYSANIYVDNSSQVTVENNVISCATTSDALPFYRAGKPASGILMGEESYSGWGATLQNVSIISNIIYGCRGISFYGAEVSPGGLKGAVIRHNTIWNMSGAGAIYIASEPQNTNISISYNIAPGTITSTSGVSQTDNITTVSFASAPNPNSIDSFRIAPNTKGYQTHGYQFSSTNMPSPTTVSYNAADINRDGSVNIFDYNTLLANFGTSGTLGFIPSDIDKNGTVDIFDYNRLLTEFGK